MNIILQKLNTDQQVSVARFNDGECMAIFENVKSTSRGEQDVTETLRSGLIQSLKYESETFYKGFPCPHCYPRYYRDLFSFVFNRNLEKLGEFPKDFSRFILATFATNHNYLNFLEELEGVVWGEWALVSDKDISWGGPHKHIYCPSRNAMDDAERIIKECKSLEEQIIILTCGAASNYIAMELDKVGKSALDLGSIFDPIKGKKKRNGKMIDAHIWNGFTNNTKFCGICNHAGI